MREWVAVILGAVALAALLYSVKPIYAATALLIPPLYLVHSESARQRRVARIEEELPRALLELATLPTHSYRDIIRYLSRGYGPLSEEFRRIGKLIKSGIPPEKAMRTVAERSGSALLSNAVSIIVTGIRSGSNWSDLIRGTAEDIEAIIDMERERKSALALQKYVTLLSAAVFVPAVLGITMRMVGRLTGEGPLESGPILEAVIRAIPMHILALAVMASIFVAFLEGRPKRALIYVAILIPLATGTYLLAGGALV